MWWSVWIGLGSLVLAAPGLAAPERWAVTVASAQGGTLHFRWRLHGTASVLVGRYRCRVAPGSSGRCLSSTGRLEIERTSSGWTGTLRGRHGLVCTAAGSRTSTTLLGTYDCGVDRGTLEGGRTG